MGLLLEVLVTGADVTDRDGACEIISGMEGEDYPRLEEFVADAGYRGDKFEHAAYVQCCWDVKIVTRRDDQKGFEVQPIRWIVERTFAWLSRCRRLAKDVERKASSSAAFIRLAMIRIMTRRLATAN